MKTAKSVGRPLLFLSGTLLVATFILIVTHLVIATYDRDYLASYARHIMTRGLEVADESGKIVSKVNAIRDETCSDKFLDEIRYLSFTSVFISDIGYIRDHQLKCTAMRGRLPEPVTMSVPDAITRYGQRIWTSFSGIVDPRITADMMESKNVLLFPTPAAFRDIYVPYNGFGAVLINHRHDHVFRLFGDTAGLVRDVNEMQGFAWWHKARFTECSKRYDICVMARNTQIGLFSLSATATVFIILAALAAGGMFTFALLQYISNTRSLQNKLRMAISRDDIYINYQPFVDIDTGRVIGYEALARWKEVNGDNIPPDVFIKLAESTHQIKALTRSVVTRKLTEIAPLLRENNALFVSINITTADVTEADFRVFLEEEVDKSRLHRKQFRGSYSQGTGYKQYGLGTSGTLLIHPGGVTYGPYVSDTFALVKAKGAKGAEIKNGQGAKIDSFGYAIMPSLSPYQYNTVSLDPRGLNSSVDIQGGSQQVVPYSGAIVQINFG